MNEIEKKNYPNPKNEPGKKQASDLPMEKSNSPVTQVTHHDSSGTTGSTDTNVEIAKSNISDSTQTDQRPD